MVVFKSSSEIDRYVPVRDIFKNRKRIEQALNVVETQAEKELLLVMKNALENTRRQLLRLAEKDQLTKAQMAKFNRLKGLEKSLADTWKEAFAASDKIIDKLAKVQFNESFFMSGWSIDQNSGVWLNWGQLDIQTIRESLKNDYLLIAKKGIKENGLLGIRRVITAGLAQERSYPQITKELKKFVERRSASEYQRIIRTESQRARQLGHDYFDDQAEKKGYNLEIQWLATLDGETRESHQAMDGRIRDPETKLFQCEFVPSGHISGPLGEGGTAEFVINCRCTTIEVIKDMPMLVRRSREQGVIPATDYETWKNKRPTGSQGYTAVNKNGKIVIHPK